nr:polygalacturonase QRT2-like [Ipomoea batatas]
MLWICCWEEIWTSTLQRTILTASPIVGLPKIQWRALDEINVGVCDGMTYEEVKKNMRWHGEFFAVILIIGLVSSRIASQGVGSSFNVMDYGATGDGSTDDSQAFLNAWKDACSSTAGSTLLTIPQNLKFLVHPITFSGPCNSEKINFAIMGTILAPTSPSIWGEGYPSQWLAFQDVTGLNIYGSGTIDGQGKVWWDQSCRDHPGLEGCKSLAPTALKLISCNQGSLSNIIFSNSPQSHVLIYGCNDFRVDSVAIQSPGDSPNTDGIHIQSSHQLSITNSKISTGDDCVSIGDYTSDVEINFLTCGPGHGISIGSLGKSGNVVQVENIHVSNAFLYGTTNGARIKTWQAGKGYVRNVIFENLVLHTVNNPIIIDQYYCEDPGACQETGSGVQISEVTFRNIYGTSGTDVTVNLNCSKAVPCTDIHLQFVQLAPAQPGNLATANCNNAYGQEFIVVPGPCLI